MPTSYLPIQPAPSGDSRRRDQDENNERAPKKKRFTRPNACETCRMKKTRCNGARPSCSMCVRKGTRCVYATNRLLDLLAQQPHDYLEILNWLRGSSITEGANFLQQLMTASNPSKIFSSLQGDMHGRYYPSNLRAARSSSPPTSSALDFELTAGHPNIYRPLVPLDAEILGIDPLGSGTSSLWSDSREAGPSWSQRMHLLSKDQEMDSSTDGETPTSSKSLASEVFGPLPNFLYDQRLHQLDIGYWTTVDIRNEIAARIISHYFETDHPNFSFFDPNLLIGDLVNHRLQFCSAWLVNALLAYACLSYSTIDPKAKDLSQLFFNVTNTLWRAERSTDCDVNLAALMTFAVSCHLVISDVSPIDLLEEGRRMAERLRLFDVEHTNANTAVFDGFSPEKRQFTAHVAWGAFNFLTTNNFYCPTRPILFPPSLPIPGTFDGTRFAKSRAATATPELIDQAPGELSKLWSIMQEVAVVQFAARLYPDTELRPPLAFAESKYQKLLYWTDTLPREPMSDHLPDQLATFHAVMSIFYPFLREAGSQPLRSFSSPSSSVEAVLQASTNQLKRLVLTCRLRNSRLLSILDGTAALHVSNAMIRNSATANHENDDDDPDWRFYFLHCLGTFKDLAARFPVFGQVSRGLLAMAIRDRVMAADEAQAIIQVMRMRGKESEESFGVFTIDFELALTDIQHANVKTMAEKFDELVVFDAFTQAQDFVIQDGDRDG